MKLIGIKPKQVMISTWQDRFRTKLGYPKRLGAEVRIRPIHVWPDPVWKERSVALQCFSWIFERVYRQMQLRTLGVVPNFRDLSVVTCISIPYTYPTYNILQLLHPSCWGEPHWTTRYCCFFFLWRSGGCGWYLADEGRTLTFGPDPRHRRWAGHKQGKR